MVFVLAERFAAVAAAPRLLMLIHVALEATIRPEAAPTDRALKRTIRGGHYPSFRRPLLSSLLRR